MNQLHKFSEINTLIFDVDGVFTNSEILITEEGHLLRSMNIRDGLAIKMALKQEDLNIGIISGGKSEGVRKRLLALGIDEAHIFLGVEDKLETFQAYHQKFKFDPDKVLYMGDDLPDFQVMQRIGLPACPNDAAREILAIAKYVSPFKGGQGCVRDVIEKVLRIREEWSFD